MPKEVIKSFVAKRNKWDEDSTEIKLGDDGNIVVEFRVWDDVQKKHLETALRLMPEEAHLLAKMLLRNANRSNEATAAQTAFAVSS
jgi:hypothetical protein